MLGRIKLNTGFIVQNEVSGERREKTLSAIILSPVN